MTWRVSGSYWFLVTNELLLPYFVKKNVTKGQRQRLKSEKDTKVSTCQVVYRKSDQLRVKPEAIAVVLSLTSKSFSRVKEDKALVATTP